MDFLDFSKFASAWSTALGDPNFNGFCDLDDDNDVDINDLALLAGDWLLGVKYPYSPPQTDRQKLNFNTGWKFYKGDISGDEAYSARKSAQRFRLIFRLTHVIVINLEYGIAEKSKPQGDGTGLIFQAQPVTGAVIDPVQLVAVFILYI